MQNFIKIGQMLAKITLKFEYFTRLAWKQSFALFWLFWSKELKEIEIFLNFRVGRHLSTWILKFSIFWSLISLGMQICLATWNFIKIGQMLAIRS